MSGRRKRAKRAFGCPLDGRVSALFELSSDATGTPLAPKPSERFKAEQLRIVLVLEFQVRSALVLLVPGGFQ